MKIIFKFPTLIFIRFGEKLFLKSQIYLENNKNTTVHFPENQVFLVTAIASRKAVIMLGTYVIYLASMLFSKLHKYTNTTMLSYYYVNNFNFYIQK